MSIDRHHILKTSKKFDKLDITILNNSNVFKENNTDKIMEDISEWQIPDTKPNDINKHRNK